jgi:hypothetical protein
MLNPNIHAALAHERIQALLAQAEADRRSRRVRLHRHPAWLRPGRSRPRYEIVLGPAE